MATPKPALTGTTDGLAESTWDQYPATPGKHATKLVYARIRYTGSAWQVEPSTDSQEITSNHLTWDTDHLEVSVSGFTRAPHVQVSPVMDLAAADYAQFFLPAAKAVSAEQVQIAWY